MARTPALSNRPLTLTRSQPSRVTARSTPSTAPAATRSTTSTGWVSTATARGARARTSALTGITEVFQTPATTVVGPAQVAKTMAGVRVKSATTLQFSGLTIPRELQIRTVDVQFGTLKPKQFDALKAAFGNRSQVPFDSARAYDAIDFLPPAAQALANRDLDTGVTPVTIPNSKRLAASMQSGQVITISSTPNCHGTAWEIMRAYQGSKDALHLGFGDAMRMQDTFDRFTEVARAVPGEKLDLSKLAPGDMVNFSTYVKPDGDRDLVHSAVYAGEGLFFEKPDTESDVYGETPYRLVTLPQVVAPLVDLLGPDLSVTARRPKGQLPKMTEVFGAPADDAAALERLLNRQGKTTGRPLTIEFEMSSGGGILGAAFNAVIDKPVTLAPNGRGVI